MYCFSSGGRSFTADMLTKTEPSATIHYSSLIQPKLQPMYDFTKIHKPRDTIYRGVCLPKNLTDLFPNDDVSEKYQINYNFWYLLKPKKFLYLKKK